MEKSAANLQSTIWVGSEKDPVFQITIPGQMDLLGALPWQSADIQTKYLALSQTLPTLWGDGISFASTFVPMHSTNVLK